MHCGELIKTDTDNLEEGINFCVGRSTLISTLEVLGLRFGVIQTITELTRSQMSETVDLIYEQ